ncbi:hypothetical protein LSUE1_G003831 [Lachnellula suecica]|uniref:Uncharacterized protein n=1 Tax=Lachnellula suecica TaxID=602035 RepID=A0A8T9CIH2_9HELO|nr:hypothetical protein LSUE1_G003831 [Lachnellula suecica]
MDVTTSMQDMTLESKGDMQVTGSQLDEPQRELSATPEKSSSTLFPKITGKVDEFVHSVNYQLRMDLGLESYKNLRHVVVKLIGTVKLHGAHADILIHADDTIQLQSRNMVGLSNEKDAYGIAKALLPLKAEALDLKAKYRQRYLELNPKVEINEDINNAFLPDEPYADIQNEDAGFYNISRGGFYHEEFDFNTPEASRERLQVHTVAVEKECPFAKTFGISGAGEGIVWKAEHPLGNDARRWLKTKGASHSVTTTEKVKVAPSDSDLEKAQNFAEAAVTNNRLEQGWGYLEEMGIKRDMKGLAQFMKWISNDVEVEERLEIQKLEIKLKLLRAQMASTSKAWYLERLKQPTSL